MKIAIAGAGLVGSLFACMLGRKGHQVEVFELRHDNIPDPMRNKYNAKTHPLSPEGKQSQGRSINLAISTRGRASLAILGLEDLVLSQAIPLKGRLIHNPDGTKKEQLYDLIGNDCIYSISRSYLSEVIVKGASSKAVKNPNVTFHYDHKILHADLEKGILTLSNNAKTSEIVHADMIVGADGVHSNVRKSLLRRPRTNFRQTYIEHGYLELNITATENGLHAIEKNYLHIWPRSLFMLIALPNMDGTFTGTLFMPYDIYEELNTPERVEELFEKHFGDVINFIGRKQLVETVLNNKLSHLLSVQCHPFHAGRGVLLGDAAHAMVPFYGQGMNAGFEDVLILDKILNNCETKNVEECIAKFTEERSKDAVAICDLAMDHYLEMRYLVNQRGYCMRRIMDTFLHRILGDGWIPLYNAVTFSRIPYSKCISHRKWQDEKLETIFTVGGRCLALLLFGCLLFVAFYCRSANVFRASSLDNDCLAVSNL